MLTEERLGEIMEEEVEKILSKHEEHTGKLSWEYKKSYLQGALENIDPDEVELTEEEARELYRNWLESIADEIGQEG